MKPQDVGPLAVDEPRVELRSGAQGSAEEELGLAAGGGPSSPLAPCPWKSLPPHPGLDFDSSFPVREGTGQN